jgi:pilus assembly protein CpaB
MRPLPSWVWLVLAVVSGTMASFLALGWLKGQARTTEAPVKVSVVVARQEIATGTLLTLAQVQLAGWQGSLPGGAVSRLEAVEGRFASAPFAAGEPITEAKLAPKGTAANLNWRLPPDKRAMTVKVDEASGVAGFVTPDSRVDVVVTLDKGEFGKDPVSKVIFQNLRVLGIGQRLESSPGDKPQVVPTVTLEVTAVEGERLALSAQEGRISLVLRGQGDTRLVDTPGASAGGLFGRLSTAPPAPAATPPLASAPPRRTVEVIRGLQREPAQF